MFEDNYFDDKKGGCMKKMVQVISTFFLICNLVGLAHAELQRIGIAEYDSDDDGLTETYQLIWEKNNNGSSLVWLDYSNPEAEWNTQNAWASSLSDKMSISLDTGYELVWLDDAWRLSHMIDSFPDYGYDGSTHTGYNITNSELGHLFFTELGNLSNHDIYGNPQAGYGLTNSGVFDNLLGSWYWSSVDYSIQPVHAWYFTFSAGFQSVNPKSWEMYGLAVRSAKVTFDHNQTVGPVFETAAILTNYIQWTDVELANEYDSMVVVCTPTYTKKAPPTVIRIQNAIGNSFQIMAQNVDGQVEPYDDIISHCMVIEEGIYTTENNGVKLEAIKVESAVVDRAGRWRGQELIVQNQYENPVVLGQVTTWFDQRFSTFWARGVSKKVAPSTGSIFVGKHIGEDTDRERSSETLAVIITETGPGTISGLNYIAGVGDNTVIGITNNKSPIPYPFLDSIDGQLAILSMAGMNGGNGGWPVLYGEDALFSNSLFIAVDEDQIKDVERSHIPEQLSYIVFE